MPGEKITYLTEDDAAFLRELIGSVRTLGGSRTGISALIAALKRPSPPSFPFRPHTLGRITGHATLESGSATIGGGSPVTVAYKFKYPWTEVQRTKDGVEDVPEGIEGTEEEGYLINLAESFHTERFSFSADIEHEHYPENFRPQPLGATGKNQTHSYDIIVPVWLWWDEENKLWPHTFMMGSHDGECAT